MSPSPYGSEAEAMAALTYPEYRRWRAEYVLGRPYPKRRKAERVKPDAPGALPMADPEEG